MMEPVDMDQVTGRAPAADLTEKNWAADGHIPTEDSPRAIINSLFIDPLVLENHNKHLQAKYDLIAKNECRWQEEQLADAEIVLVAYGTTSRIARSAMRKCRERGIKVGLLRPITLWPFPEAAIRQTLATAKDYLVLEMSMGQMVDDVRLAVNGERPVHFYGRTGGMVPTVGEMVSQIEKLAGVAPLHDEACIFDFGKAMDDAAKKLGEIADTVGRKLDEAGKKAHETMSSPEYKEKAQDIADQIGAAVETAGQKLDEAGQKVSEALNSPELKQKAKDAADSVDTAADTVGKKLDEAGQKVAQAVNSAEFQQTAQDVGKHVSDFATRTAETVTKGVSSIFGAIGKAFESVQKDLKDIETQQQAKDNKPLDHDGKEGE